jgi:hypothetical protein
MYNAMRKSSKDGVESKIKPQSKNESILRNKMVKKIKIKNKNKIKIEEKIVYSRGIADKKFPKYLSIPCAFPTAPFLRRCQPCPPCLCTCLIPSLAPPH